MRHSYLFLVTAMACGADSAPDTGLPSHETTSGTVTGSPTGTTTGTSPRASIMLQVDADGRSIDEVASPGDLCPTGWMWFGVLVGGTQCISPGSASAVALVHRPDGVSINDGVAPAEICPLDWTFRGESLGRAICTRDGDGTVLEGDTCPADSIELGSGYNPESYCYRPEAGTWFYVWNNAAGEHFSEVSDPAQMCPADFVVDGIGCYRPGPGAVVEIRENLDGERPVDNAMAASLCSGDSVFVGSTFDFTWANCLYPEALTSVEVVEDTSGHTLDSGATPEELCPAGFDPVGLSGPGVICVSS